MKKTFQVVDFGCPVIIRAELMRVRASKAGYIVPATDEVDTTLLRFETSRPYRDGGRYAYGQVMFEDSRQWPGQPVHPDILPKFGNEELEPTDPEKAYRRVRMRRFPYSVPQFGVVIGWTHKQEGSIESDGSSLSEGHQNYLSHYRDINVVEVAVRSGTNSGKASIILALPGDLEPIGASA